MFDEDREEEKKVVDFTDGAFLSKLSNAVKKIEEYQSFLVPDMMDSGRKMKMQGVVSKNCRINI